MSRILPLVEQEPNILSYVREVVEYATNGDALAFPSAPVLEELRGWGTSVETRTIIRDVCKARLSLPWPYNYKALTVLALQPPETLAPLKDQLKALADSDIENQWVKLYASSLLAAVPIEEEKKEEQEKVWNVPMDIPWGLWAVVWVEPRRCREV